VYLQIAAHRRGVRPVRHGYAPSVLLAVPHAGGGAGGVMGCPLVGVFLGADPLGVDRQPILTRAVQRASVACGAGRLRAVLPKVHRGDVPRSVRKLRSGVRLHLPAALLADRPAISPGCDLRARSLCLVEGSPWLGSFPSEKFRCGSHGA
jgi:hypothetical protein